MEEQSQKLVENLKQRKLTAAQGGGVERAERQKAGGKLTARERLNLLFDVGTFTELGTLVTHRCTDFGMADKHFECEAVVTGFGQIEGRAVCAFAQDFTIFGGSLSLAAGQKISELMEHARRVGMPIIGINDSGGARIQEGVDSLAGYGSVFYRNVALSGVVPQITIIAGPTAGGAVYSPALNDFIFMVRSIGQMYITGPEVIKSVTGEQITHEELGGVDTHSTQSGVAQFVANSEEECYQQVKRLLRFLPSNNRERPNAVEPTDPPTRKSEVLRTIVPTDSNAPYDVAEIIKTVVDDGHFMPVHEDFAGNIVVGFARLAGDSVGIVANQPNVRAGMLDVDASVKAARFVRFCDAFNIPLITFVDVPGFMPGSDEERAGIIRHGAKLIYAYAEATVPKITVVLRKAYGGAYIVMNSKELGADLNLAWPTAEIAVMGPAGAINIISRSELAKAKDAEKLREKLVGEYRDNFANPYFSANRGYIDDVIDPAETRATLARALNTLRDKVEHYTPEKKHGNLPL